MKPLHRSNANLFYSQTFQVQTLHLCFSECVRRQSNLATGIIQLEKVKAFSKNFFEKYRHLCQILAYFIKSSRQSCGKFNYAYPDKIINFTLSEFICLESIFRYLLAIFLVLLLPKSNIAKYVSINFWQILNGKWHFRVIYRSQFSISSHSKL